MPTRGRCGLGGVLSRRASRYPITAGSCPWLRAWSSRVRGVSLGVGVRVSGIGLRFWGFGLLSPGSDSERGFGCRVSGLELWISRFGCLDFVSRVLGFGFDFQVAGIRVSRLGFHVSFPGFDISVSRFLSTGSGPEPGCSQFRISSLGF